MPLLIMAVLLVPLLVALRRDYSLGLAWAAFFWIWTPLELRFPLPGALPELTFHRLLLIIMFTAFFRSSPGTSVRVLGGSHLVGLIVCYAVSLLFSDVKGIAFKATLGFALESVLFYFLMARSIKGMADIERILTSITLGLIVVAFFTWIEKYAQINVFERALGYTVGAVGDITASYRHRILLGYGMAMALPLVILHLVRAESRTKKFLAVLALCAVAGAVYFPRSRGPWLGAVLAGGSLFWLSDFKVRRILRWLAIVGVVVLLLRPGVWDTINNLLFDTSAQSVKGRSYNYRWELWGAAWGKIWESPINLLFGYGASSHETMNLSHMLTMGGNPKKLGYTSFDNNYAALLLELGIVGFALTAWIYSLVCTTLFKSRAWLTQQSLTVNAAVLSSVGIYLFAMTNVYIFSPQLHFLFWTLIAIGAALPHFDSDMEIAPDAQTDDVPEDGGQYISI